jgi:thiaminase (transcriptional activator TenA)
MRSLSQILRTEHRALSDASLRSPFVRGLSDGTLPREAFQGYIAQDAFFLEAFARAYAVAVSRAPDRGTLETFAGLLNGVLDELRLHDGYAAAWGVSLVGVTPLPATLAYTDFLAETAAGGSLAEIAAAMTPCMRLYADLGQALAAEQPGGTPGDDHPYGAWIRTYADPGFEGLAAMLEALLDGFAAQESEGDGAPGASPDPAPHGPERISALYRRALELEYGFFAANL